ncbi:phenylalanine--tRNA ligase beta subunit-related protein [Paenibacillus sp. FSL R7-0297]|uniref:B3/B4 domain-containing protein n=1 Tax=unclassified Paenibacillus TaxID=185978 RepID=UPI0006949BBB|nr:phenylalanine--tRNA ligase beta subunit-related protein [Paenibacillus sp. FSL R5-0912]
MNQVHTGKEESSRAFKVEFSEDVFEIAPDLHVGLIATSHIANLDRDSEVNALLAHMEQEIMNSGLQKESISEIPTIAAWRKVYSQFGVKPARYPCAAESLIRRVVEQGALARIHTLVNLCNAISLKCRTPIASCDISDIQEFVIRRAAGNEPFLPIGKVDECELPSAGEIIYADDAGRAHSRRWNWRQSDHIKTTAESSQMLFTIEAVHKEARVLVEATTFLLNELLQPFTGAGRSEWAFIHKDSPVHTFQLHTGEVFADRDRAHEASEERYY